MNDNNIHSGEVLQDEQLENAAGGVGVCAPPKTCPMCGGTMPAMLDRNLNLVNYCCSACHYKER